jgi:glycosyltransferase involved in cell wall biosynthesis
MTDQVPDTERPVFSIDIPDIGAPFRTPLVTCLCVTHERLQWQRWMRDQVRKQTIPSLLAVVDSSAEPNLAGTFDNVFHYNHVAPPAIAPKRNIALASVTTPYFAWFDDDDWSHPERLERCVRLLEACPELVAAGGSKAYKIDARTLASYSYRTGVDPIIFNGAVYRTSHWQGIKFNEALAVAEDTDWQSRGLRKQAWGTIDGVLSSWFCHSSNIANHASRIMFYDKFPAQLMAYKAELESNPEYAR